LYELTTSVVVVVKGVALLGGGMPVVLWVRVQGQSVIVRVSDWEVVSRVFERDLREKGAYSSCGVGLVVLDD